MFHPLCDLSNYSTLLPQLLSLSIFNAPVLLSLISSTTDYLSVLTMSAHLIPVVDLTDIPSSDDERDEHKNEVPNSSLWLQRFPEVLCKVTHRKIASQCRLKKGRITLAKHVYYSLFSEESKKHLKELQDACKWTNVYYSVNPYFDRALFAGETIKKGAFITLYIGLRLPYNVCDALQRDGRPPNFALSLPKGVVIDSLGYPYGAGMANHSCSPNANLRYGYLCGSEGAPYAFLEALKDIEVGQEIECDYGYLNKYTEKQLDEIIAGGRFIRCRCLKPNCRLVFHT